MNTHKGCVKVIQSVCRLVYSRGYDEYRHRLPIVAVGRLSAEITGGFAHNSKTPNNNSYWFKENGTITRCLFGFTANFQPWSGEPPSPLLPYFSSVGKVSFYQPRGFQLIIAANAKNTINTAIITAMTME
jgi:hypothetical protein